jgi:hypothetical protein
MLSTQSTCIACALSSLERHRDREAVLRLDEVVDVFGVLVDIDLHPVHLTIELPRLVILGHGRTGFAADIQRFVG